MSLKHNLIGTFSDIHIGLGQDSSMWHDATLNFAHWVKDFYQAKGIDDIIIPGDIFHNRNEISVHTLNAAKEFFDILSDFNIYISTGNHDCYYKDRSDVNSISLLNKWNNIIIADVNPITLTYKNKSISLIPWATPLSDIPESDIIFGHFEINSFHMNTHKICDKGVESEALLNKSPFIISGHFHKKCYRKYSTGEVCYLGSPYQQNFGDVGDERGIYILDLNANSLDFHPNKVSPIHVKIFVSHILNRLQDSEYLKSNIPDNIVSLVIDETLSSDKISLISSKIQKLNPKSFRIDYKLDSEIIIGQQTANYSSVDVPKSIEDFVESLDVQYKPDVVNYLNHIYNKLTV
jgi:DNA repair exonuclease SbcCD nuclease subunit